MSSASLMDYLAEKFYSYSSKMRGDSYQSSMSSFLMNGSNSHLHDVPQLLSEFKESVFHSETSLPNYPFQPLFRPFRLLGGFRYFCDMDKPSHFPNCHSENWVFSPHLFNLVSDSYRYKHSHNYSALIPSAKMVLCSTSSQDKDTMPNNSTTLSQHPESEVMKTACDMPATEEAKAFVDMIHSPTAKIPTADVKCDISHSLRLNLELTQRKTKEINKRSKKRRRRQKKSEQISVNSSTSTSDDDADSELLSPVTNSVSLVADSELQSSVTNGLSLVAESPNFECTFSLTHTLQMSPCKSSFLIPVESNSDDDSDWETIDIEEFSSNSNATSGCERTSDGLSSSDSSPVKSDSSVSVSSSPIKCSFQVSRSLMSFVAPESDSDDDHSDWDSCETAIFTEDAEFEFTGLFLTNLCVPHTATTQSDFDSITPEQECNEIIKLRADLLEANRKWDELSGKGAKPKSASKVTFAPEEKLVEVFAVEVFERKGEWETYATERLRFKRKIDELEKVLSPCLNPEHRSKIFKTIIEPNL